MEVIKKKFGKDVKGHRLTKHLTDEESRATFWAGNGDLDVIIGRDDPTSGAHTHFEEN